ncbi:M48 family metalloprotease [Amylibacter sp. SFDW26]|uniref:M48 family metalloprotease n=1 Tax=Amylibacter sp. SFDW26 TaxID=2652722 RepID=UPI001D031C51|nr:M48 family metalloprotease [Amylibacter sp. SFDW26]
MFWSPIAYAQGLIRDAEIERTLRIIAEPIIKAAGIGRVNIFIINSNSPNAFATGGNNVFLSSGLIRRMKNVEMLQSVIAHEIGHLTGGHLAQRAANIGSANTAAGVGVLLGILTAAAGGGGAGVGVAAATSSAGQRNFLAFTRAQESAADQAGARYMARAGINPAAALDVLNIFRGQEALNISRQDSYAITHPLHSQRIADLKTVVAAYKGNVSTQNPNVDYWYARSVAKFNGFIGSPKGTLRRVSKTDKGEIATLTRAIAYHRLPNKKKSMVEIKRLLAMRPADPYYQELYGQMLLENGNASAATAAYAKAVNKLPKDAQILAGLGRAQLAQNTKSSTQAALKTLKRSYARDPRNGRMLRDLGVAYAKTGNPGMASITSAERYALASNFKLAAVHAERAEKLLPQGSTGWRKAVDILSIAKRTSKIRKKR